MRREYKINLRVNKIIITKAIIDPHFEEKHSESINDEIILELIQKLDGHSFEAETKKGEYSYYVTNKIEHQEKVYKLIWLLEDNNIYIGIINAYRRGK